MPATLFGLNLGLASHVFPRGAHARLANAPRRLVYGEGPT